MPCYARACRRVRPCPSHASCEATWHACTPPDDSPIHRWQCTDCRCLWTLHADDNTWYRDPLDERQGG